MKKHPTDLQLEALYLEQDSERRRMLLHVTGCVRCQEGIAEILRRRTAGATPDEEPDRGGREPGPDDLAGPATLYAEQGRTAELKRLAAEMVPIFSSLHIHREALAALAFLTQAIESEAAGLEVLSAVADYLRRAAHEPELRFRQPTAISGS